jgi:DNA-binding SARP family transcriptional activator
MQMVRRLCSVAGLLLILLGAPAFLLQTTGVPALGGLPDVAGLSRAIDLRWVPLGWVVSLLALVAWALWLCLAVSGLLRIAGHAERRLRSDGWIWRASETFAWAPVKVIVDVALGAILLTSALSHSSAQASPSQNRSGWSAVIAPQVAALRAEAPKPRQTNGVHPPIARERDNTFINGKSEPRETQATYLVRAGDSLWSIAEAKMGDPYRWTEIWELNRNRQVADGHRFSKAGFIQPGWRLRLPVSEPNQHRGAKDPGRDVSKHPRRNEIDVRRPSKGARSPIAKPPEVDRRHDDRVELSSGSAVTVGFIAGFLSAIGVVDLLRRRRREPTEPSPGWPRARSRHDLKARFVRLVKPPDNAPTPPEPVDTLARSIQSPAGEIVLGHRQGKPVLARQRGCAYSLSGPSQDVRSYLQDLALHAALSHRHQVEIWTTQDFELSGLPSRRVFPDARTLVSELEIEILKRHRMFDEEGAQAWEAHQEGWGDDPLALVLGIVPSHDLSLRNRFHAVATQGHDLGIIVLAAADGDASLRIDGHMVRPLDPGLGLGMEPFETVHFSDADRREVLRQLAAGTGDLERAEQTEYQVAPSPGASDASIRVKLLGRPVIEGVDEQPSDGFGAKSREFLFLFLLNPQGLTLEEAIEMLWPETETEQGIQRFKFQLRKVRHRLRNDLAPTAKFIDKIADMYRPLPDLFSVDVWEFDLHLAEARGSSALESLSQAVELYRGELLQGLYYEWAEPLRAHFRERLLNALVKLSDLSSAEGDDEGALKTALRAIEAEPYAEHFYRRAMTIYGRLGRASDIKRIYRELEAALSSELDAEPDPETSDLKDRLLKQLRQSA